MHKHTLTCRRILTAILATSILQFFHPSTLHAQSDDFGMDFSLSAEKKLRPGTHVSIEGGVRTMDHTKKVDRWTAGIGMEQRLYQNDVFDLKTDLKWEYMWVNYPEQTKNKYEDFEYFDGQNYYTATEYMGFNHRHQFWRGRHRTSLSLSAGYEPNKRWSFSLREMVQYSHFNKGTTTMERYRVDDEDEDVLNLLKDNVKQYKAKDRFVLRSRIGVAYNIRHCPVDPYATAEYGCGLHHKANKWKYTAGAEFKLNKQNKIDLFYRYQTEDDDDEPNGHFLGIGYNFKF